jgi:hypothetical protein
VNFPEPVSKREWKRWFAVYMPYIARPKIFRDILSAINYAEQTTGLTISRAQRDGINRAFNENLDILYKNSEFVIVAVSVATDDEEEAVEQMADKGALERIAALERSVEALRQLVERWQAAMFTAEDDHPEADISL